MMTKLMSVTFFMCALVVGSRGYAVVLSPLKDTRGQALVFTYQEALKACPQNTHLPTVRELAKELQDQGALGILEVAAVNWNLFNEFEDFDEPYRKHLNRKLLVGDYNKVHAIESDGKTDTFYFSSKGFKPYSEERIPYMWTSSANSENEGAYGLDLTDGSLSGNLYRIDEGDNRTHRFPIICFPNVN